VNYSRLVLPGAALLVLFLTGCSTSSKTAQTTDKSKKAVSTTKNGQLFAVSADSAAFFKHGPQPGRDPDQKLPRQTLVKLIRPSFGFSKVQLVASGEQGYVKSDEISPASSAALIAATTPTPSDSLTPETTPAVEQFNLNSNDPRLVPPPEELPNPDLPAFPPGQ
jgi:hypothetical protein